MAKKETKAQIKARLEEELQKENTITRRSHRKTDLRINKTSEGDTIEQAMERMLNNEVAMQINENTVFYSAPEDGVIPESDIRTRRFDEAISATDKVTASIRAWRDMKYEDRRKVMKEYREKQKGGTDTSDKVDATTSQPTD